jgi:hypothetical protein
LWRETVSGVLAKFCCQAHFIFIIDGEFMNKCSTFLAHEFVHQSIQSRLNAFKLSGDASGSLASFLAQIQMNWVTYLRSTRLQTLQWRDS